MTGSDAGAVLTERIIGAAINVHRGLGPGLLESVYEECLCVECEHVGLSCQRQVALPLIYRGRSVGSGFRVDLVIEGHAIVEVKAVEALLPVHQAQLLTYLRLSELPVGLLLNFNATVLKDGIRRLANTRPPSLRSLPDA